MSLGQWNHVWNRVLCWSRKSPRHGWRDRVEAVHCGVSQGKMFLVYLVPPIRTIDASEANGEDPTLHCARALSSQIFGEA